MIKVTQFKDALNEKFKVAENKGAFSLKINSGEFHRELGVYPDRKHSMPTCCNVMHSEFRNGDEIISSPPKGQGATLTILYKLPR